MEHKSFPYPLYLVTDEAACLGRDFFWVVEEAIKGGVDVVQLREKKLNNTLFLEKALRLKELLSKYRIPLIINDNIWVAMQCDADGIHVGNSDTPPTVVRQQWGRCAILGCSVEYEDQLHTENAAVSDYLALSPVFATPTKTDTITEWRPEGVRHIRALTTKPIVAIGGITELNAADVLRAGADSLAIVSAICGALRPAYAAERFKNIIINNL